MAKNEELQAMLEAALNAYEQARAARLQTELQANAARQQSHAESIHEVHLQPPLDEVRTYLVALEHLELTLDSIDELSL